MKLVNFSSLNTKNRLNLYSRISDISLSDLKQPNLIEFNLKTMAWCQRTNSDYYGIFNQDEILGTISLSKQNLAEKTACIGYEVFEEFRERGIASKAFELVLEIARKKGFETVKATIVKDNIASLKIWQQHCAEFRVIAGNKLEACLEIG